MKYLLVAVILCLADGLCSRPGLSIASYANNVEAQPLHSSTTAARHKLPGYSLQCNPLKTDQPEKHTLTSSRPACLEVEVAAGEATQLQLDQPGDLAMRLTGESVDRRIDGFEFGIETLTIAEPGIYRVEVAKADSSPGPLTFSIVRWKLEMNKASAWQQAEDWATIAKKTKKIEDIDKSLALWLDLGDNSSIARTYLKQGSAVHESDPASARTIFEKALELCRAAFETRCSAEAENNSGLMSSRLGDFMEARQRLEEAARDWQQLADKEREGVAFSNLGLMFSQSGDFYQAISMLNRSEGLLRNRNILRRAIVLNNLGLSYQSLAEYGKARWYFQTAMSDYLRSKDPSRFASSTATRMNLGRNYMLEENLPRAQKILELSVAEANQLPALQLRADTLRNLAQCLYKRKRLEQARPKLELTLEVDRHTGSRRGQGSDLHYLGLIARDQGDITTARSLLAQSLQLQQEVGLRDDASETLFALADLEYHDGHPDAASNFAEQALKLLESIRSRLASPNQRAIYYSRKRRFFNLLVEMAMRPGNPNAASDGLLAAEQGRARSLMDLLAEGKLLQLPPGLAERRDEIQRQIDYLVKQTNKLNEKLRLLLAESNSIEDRIRESIKDQPLGQPLRSIDELQKSIPPDSGILEYQLGTKQSHLWLVDAHQVRTFTLPSEIKIESDARPVVHEFGDILERRREPGKQAAFKEALDQLSATLLGRLAGIQLPPRLILVLDGVLNRVPFAALKLPHSSKRLGLVYDLVQVPSAEYLLAGREPPPINQFRQTILAFADPVFSVNDRRVTGRHGKSRPDSNVDLSRLVFTKEIDTIEALVPPSRRRVLSGFAASRASLSHLQLENFGVVHLSTHALINDQIPELSQITLSMVNADGRPVDGTLHPYQMAQLHLMGSIVVLSACDTALGKQVMGEGLMGFSSSLFYAGASQLVLTLTKIDAEASSNFLSTVYQQFLPKGTRSMEHSVTIARRGMARDNRYSDPYYWASFVVVGRPTDTGNLGVVSREDRR